MRQTLRLYCAQAWRGTLVSATPPCHVGFRMLATSAATAVPPRAEWYHRVRTQVAAVFEAGRHRPGSSSPPSLFFAYPEQEAVVQLVANSVHAMVHTGEYGAGDAGITIVSKRGCGKSATLRALGPAIEDVYGDGVVNVYLDMRSKHGPGTDLLRDVCRQVEAKLATRAEACTGSGAATEPPLGENDDLSVAPVHTLLDRLLGMLAQHDARMVLVLDEFDEFYTQTLDDNNRSLVSSVLTDIALLGEGASGRTLTVLCGSSAWLEMLVRGRGVFSELMAEYPVLDLRRKLDGRKFKLNDPLQHAITTDLVYQRVVPCVEHLWKGSGLHNPCTGANDRAFIHQLARGALLLAGTHIDGVKLLVGHVAKAVEAGTVTFCARDTEANVRTKVAACLFAAYTQFCETSSDSLGRAPASPVLVDAYTGVLPHLVDEFEFAWASKNGLHKHSDGQQQLEWLMASFDDLCDRLVPLDTGEFREICEEARRYSLSTHRANIGSHPERHTRKYMRRHRLMGQGSQGRLLPMCVFGATMAPRGVVTSPLDKLALTLNPAASVADARGKLVKGTGILGGGGALLAYFKFGDTLASFVATLLGV